MNQGRKQGESLRYVYNLFDRYNRETGITSMARTTGYTCTAVENLMLEGMFSQPGINPPEYIGKTGGHLRFILEYLKERIVIYRVS